MNQYTAKISVLVVAGGSGTRMGGEIPKQFLELAGKPVIVHSIEKIRKALPDAAIYVALGQEILDLWHKTAKEHGLENKCTLCEGGQSRSETVKNSLKVIQPCDLVLVHDAVRPLVSEKIIKSVIDCTLEKGAAIPAVVPVDSFRTVEDDGSSSPFDRSLLRAIQTPQGFKYDLLKKAYGQTYLESFTDDAQVVESWGFPVTLCEGSPLNIKLTYPEDMVIAEAILKAKRV